MTYPGLMTMADFARMQNVSRKTVSVWKREGRLTMNGDRIDVAASVQRLGRRARTGVDAVPSAVTLDAAERTLNAEPLPDEAAAASTAIDQGASDLARLLVARMPEAEARKIVEAWVSTQRAEWVGAPGEAAAVPADEWPAPVTCADWADHAAFAGPALSEPEWADILEEAPRKRTARKGQH